MARGHRLSLCPRVRFASDFTSRSVAIKGGLFECPHLPSPAFIFALSALNFSPADKKAFGLVLAVPAALLVVCVGVSGLAAAAYALKVGEGE